MFSNKEPAFDPLNTEDLRFNLSRLEQMFSNKEPAFDPLNKEDLRFNLYIFGIVCLRALQGLLQCNWLVPRATPVIESARSFAPNVDVLI